MFPSLFITHSHSTHTHTNAQVFITLILSTVHVSILYTFLHSHESDPDIEFTQWNVFVLQIQVENGRRWPSSEEYQKLPVHLGVDLPFLQS